MLKQTCEFVCRNMKNDFFRDAISNLLGYSVTNQNLRTDLLRLGK